MATLKSIAGSFHHTYIIFDALDEFADRAGFLGLLKEFHDWGLDSLHLLSSSRGEREIEETLNFLVSHHVPLDESPIDGDIRVYVSSTLYHDSKFKVCSAEEKKEIETTLIEGAHGM